jgi:hypothetical protein
LVYLLDASAFLELPRQVDNVAHVLDGLSEAVSRGTVSFPDAVAEEVSWLAREEHVGTWIKAIKSARVHQDASFKALGWVMHQAGDLADTTATRESSPPHVIAMAIELRGDGLEVTIATEDMHPKPTRMCMREACDQFELDRVYLHDCLERLELVSDDAT